MRNGNFPTPPAPPTGSFVCCSTIDNDKLIDYITIDYLHRSSVIIFLCEVLILFCFLILAQISPVICNGVNIYLYFICFEPRLTKNIL